MLYISYNDRSNDVSWPLKARRPVVTLGPFYELGFFCLLRPQGIRVPVPWRLVKIPRVSRHLAAAPRENTTEMATTNIRSLSDPPRQRYAARELQLG